MTEEKRNIVINCELEFGSQAITLDTREVTDLDLPEDGKEYTKTHSSGWTIKGKVQEDYYLWVNEFSAIHPDYGYVCGDFEKIIGAFSQEALDHFLKYHPPVKWDYDDI